eukprot:m51a1_g8396 hypothetical protein (560) ;mRNA; f:222598-224911
MTSTGDPSVDDLTLRARERRVTATRALEATSSAVAQSGVAYDALRDAVDKRFAALERSVQSRRQAALESLDALWSSSVGRSEAGIRALKESVERIDQALKKTAEQAEALKAVLESAVECPGVPVVPDAKKVPALFQYPMDAVAAIAVPPIGFSEGRTVAEAMRFHRRTASAAASGRPASAGTSAVSTVFSASGQLYVSGWNSDGQLGLGDNEDRTSFAANEFLASGGPVVSAACGNFHTAAVSAGGDVFVWGGNAFGMLGTGDTAARASPVQVALPSKARAVFCGSSYTLALASDGRTLYAWGDNDNGELGLGSTSACLSPKPNDFFASASRRVVSVACGACHNVALVEGGELWSWGYNEGGELGHGDRNNREAPTQVAALRGRKAVLVVAGSYHNFALLEGGEVYAWGSNDQGQLGLGDAKDRLVPEQHAFFAGRSVVCLSAGARHSAAVVAGPAGGTAVFTWGCNSDGQLGLGDTESRAAPAEVPSLASSYLVACIQCFSYAVLESGDVLAWGTNKSGELGLGDNKNRHEPTAVAVGPKGRVTGICGGTGHTVIGFH